MHQATCLVDGAERATTPDVAVDNHVNPLNGSATLSSPNSTVRGARLLHAAVTGSSYGSDVDPDVTGVRQLNDNLKVEPQDLKGRIVGLSTFTAVTADGISGTPTTYGINTGVRPMTLRRSRAARRLEQLRSRLVAGQQDLSGPGPGNPGNH